MNTEDFDRDHDDLDARPLGHIVDAVIDSSLRAAQKMALNALSTAVPVRAGGASPDQARTLLMRHGNRVRDALQAHRGER